MSVNDGKFGFVKATTQKGDLFFHISEAPQDICPGDEVTFHIGMNRSRGGQPAKECAKSLTKVEAGTLQFHEVLEGDFSGSVDALPRRSGRWDASK